MPSHSLMNRRTLLKGVGRVAPLTLKIPEHLAAAWAKMGATGRYSYQCESETTVPNFRAVVFGRTKTAVPQQPQIKFNASIRIALVANGRYQW